MGIKLYKYRPYDTHCESLILGNELFYSKPAGLNDPFDCRFPRVKQPSRTEFLQFMDILHARAKLAHLHGLRGPVPIGIDSFVHAFPDELIAKLWARTLEEAETKILHESGVYCLASTNDNVLLFSHYAASHTGLCFEFSFSLQHFIGNPEVVVYDDAYPVVDYFDPDAGGEEALAAAAIFTKAKKWEYEQEWRIFEFMKGPGTRAIDPECLTGIVLGCKASNSTRHQVQNMLKQRKHPVHLYKAATSADGYELSIEPV